MKTKLLLSSLFLLSNALMADPGPADGQFAVLKPRKACEVIVPEGRTSKANVYFSQDCQTAYILPSNNMYKTVLKPLLISDHGICDRLNSTVANLAGTDSTMKQLEVYIKNVNDQMAVTTDESTMKILERKMEIFSKQLKELELYSKTAMDPYYNTASVRTQIRVETDIMEEVAAYQKANKNVTSVEGKFYPTRFVPALIRNSVLAISSRDKKGYAGRSTLKIDFPGLRYLPSESEAKEYPTDSVLLHMNGSMSGIVDLSAMSYCSHLKDVTEGMNKTEELKKVFDSAVAINMNYEVAVQAGVRLFMKSDINTLDFLTNIQSSITNTAFSRNEFFGQLVSGQALNSLEIQIDDKGKFVDLSKIIFNQEESDEEKDAGPVALLIGQFISNYMEQVESKLTKLGLLEKIPETKAKEIAAQTRTELSGHQSICNTKSSWFGASRKTTCHSQPIYVQVNYNGISSLIKQNSDTSRITNTVTFESNQTTTVRHSSTFSGI